MACVRRAVRAMMYTDDVGIVSKSADSLKMITVTVTAFRVAGLTVS